MVGGKARTWRPDARYENSVQERVRVKPLQVTPTLLNRIREMLGLEACDTHL